MLMKLVLCTLLFRYKSIAMYFKHSRLALDGTNNSLSIFCMPLEGVLYYLYLWTDGGHSSTIRLLVNSRWYVSELDRCITMSSIVIACSVKTVHVVFGRNSLCHDDNFRMGVHLQSPDHITPVILILTRQQSHRDDSLIKPIVLLIIVLLLLLQYLFLSVDCCGCLIPLIYHSSHAAHIQKMAPFFVHRLWNQQKIAILPE